MKVKRVEVSPDGLTYYSLPGSSADLSAENNQLDDTTFGQSFKSTESGLTEWSVTSNAKYKGHAGYVAKVKRGDTPVTITNELMTSLGSNTYQITDEAKQVLNWNVMPVFRGNGNVISNSLIQNLDWTFGRVTFSSPVATPVTVTGEYVPLLEFAKATSFNLAQTADTVNTTSYGFNQGYSDFNPTLLGVSAEVSNIQLEGSFFNILKDRQQLVIEINPNGDTKARGIYKMVSTGGSGGLSDVEVESLNFGLSVPEVGSPFGWAYGSDLSMAIQTVITAYITRSNIWVRYLPEGPTQDGKGGQAIVTDASLDGAVDGMNEFSFSFQGVKKLYITSPYLTVYLIDETEDTFTLGFINVVSEDGDSVTPSLELEEDNLDNVVFDAG